jgi:hypothetical protein
MSIAALWNVPRTPAETAEWSFVNAAAHADIVRVIFQTTGQVLDSYVLDPFDPKGDSFDTWLYQHFTMHQQMDAILGIQGYDLTDADFSDESATAVWVAAHVIEHLQAAQKLNLG